MPGGDCGARSSGSGGDGRVSVDGGAPAAAQIDPASARRAADRRRDQPPRLGGGGPQAARGVPRLQADGRGPDGAGGAGDVLVSATRTPNPGGGAGTAAPDSPPARRLHTPPPPP